ncbi:MAG: hypothetical protein CMP51_00575 [Flavobacteriales bacterium]|nr:hypothetical protein [Flavobacteriales bacterium]|tara:strand:- start:312 stop:1124 length:813 start_codon:yes stop_codon:yes gene_type:complete
MSKWRKYNGALIPLTPPHIDVDTDGIAEEISKENAYFARWTSDFDSEKEGEFWYVICDEELQMSDYSRNTRNQIRRGLKNCEVRIIDKEIVLKDGFDSYNQAFIRYNTHLEAKSHKEFIQELESLGKEWEFWGIYHKAKMIGYCQNKVLEDYCDYSTIKFHPDYLKLYPSYALFYTMNQYYLNEHKFKYVNDGARSLSHETNIQSFLIQKFRFRRAYCRMHIIYNKKIRIIIKFIFPFRSIFSCFNFGIFKKVNILIVHEKIRRYYEKRN